MNSLHKNDTWELSELPKGKKAIGCKWVLAKKQSSLDSDIIRYKARLVVKDYAHREGIDHKEVFLPVVKHSQFKFCWHWWHSTSWSLISLMWRSPFFMASCREDLHVLTDGVQDYRKRKYGMQVEKWTTENSILLRSISLDIQILDPTISSWSKHLKTLTY